MYMKKKILGLCITIFIIMLCGSFVNYRITEQNNLYYDIQEIGSYTNLVFEQPEITITEVEMETEIQASLMPYATFQEVKNGEIQKGDIVYLHYSATNSQGMTEETDCEMVVGDGEFDLQFENELIGKTVNKKHSFSLLFEDTCPYEHWKGEKIEFSVEIYKVEATVFPELTKSFLKENFDVDSVEEYHKYIEDLIYDYEFRDNKENISKLAMKQIIENTIFGEEYSKQCEIRYNKVIEAYQKYAELYELSFSEVLEGFGVTEEILYETAEYNEACTEICQYIIREENLLPSAREMKNMKQIHVEKCGYDTIQQYIDDNGEQDLNECIYNEIGLNYIYEHITFDNGGGKT